MDYKSIPKILMYPLKIELPSNLYSYDFDENNKIRFDNDWFENILLNFSDGS